MNNIEYINKLVQERMYNAFGNQQRAHRIICKDGFTMSVQVGEYLYSWPRQDNAFPYTKMEVGFPTAKPEMFSEYAEMCGTEYYTDTVYPCTPAELIAREVYYHGGLMKINQSRNKREGKYSGKAMNYTSEVGTKIGMKYWRTGHGPYRFDSLKETAEFFKKYINN